MITDIYRIKTRNSVYEIHVNDSGASRCRKEGSTSWRTVKADSAGYLENLAIGPSFDVPGVVLTSMVENYVHLVVSDEPKRKVNTIGGFFEDLTEHVVRQVNPHAVVVRGKDDEESYS